MINAVKEILRGTIQIILMAMVIKVFFNFLRFGSPFSKRRMMYNVAKMNFHNQQGQNKQKTTPNGYFEYKVWRANRRNELIKKCFSLLGSGIMTMITAIKNHRNKRFVINKEIIKYDYKPVDFTIFEKYDPDCLQYMD